MNTGTKLNKKCSQAPHSANVKNGFSYLKPALQQEFTAWASDPELSQLLEKLKSQKKELWLDHYVEAIVARYLRREGCALEVEVQTQNGKSADFKVTKSSESFFVHIKHLTMNKVTSKYRDWCYKQFDKLEELRRIPKPLTVKVNLKTGKTGLTKIQAAEFVKSAKPFIEQTTKVGEEFKVLDKSGKELGNCVVIGYPVNTDHVELCPDSPDEPVTRDSIRFIDGLKEAYKQFMLGAINVILFTGDRTRRSEFESGLFGDFTLIRDNKTNQFIRTTTRHNGFWSGKKNSNSGLAVWFEIDDDDEVNFKLWNREGFLKSKLVASLFDKSASLQS